MLSPNPLQPLPPLTFADACKMADRSVAQRTGRQRRPVLVWQGVTYLRCSMCPHGERWQTADHYHSRGGGRPASQCKRCSAKRVADWRRRGEVKPRDLRRVAKATAIQDRLGCLYTLSARPSRLRNSRPSETAGYTFDVLDSVGQIDDAPTEHLNPSRCGLAPATFEAGRYQQALRYNPALTWPDWVELTRKEKRGRKPHHRGTYQSTPAPAGTERRQ